MSTRFLQPGTKRDPVSKVGLHVGTGEGDCQKLCKASGSINGLDDEISLSTFKHLDSDNASLCNSELEHSLKIPFCPVDAHCAKPDKHRKNLIQ